MNVNQTEMKWKPYRNMIKLKKMHKITKERSIEIIKISIKDKLKYKIKTDWPI